MINPLVSVCLNAIISGIYAGFVHAAMSIFVLDKYKSLGKTTLINAAFYPADLRMFWLPFLDNLNIGYFNFGVKKNLLIILDFLIVLIFHLLYTIDFSNYTFIFLFIYIGILGLVMAARDNVSIGYKFEFFPKDTLWQYEGKISASYNLGITIGGPLIFMLSSIYSWNLLFKCLNVLFLINTILNFFIANSSKYEAKKYNSIYEKFYNPYKKIIEEKKIFLILLAFLVSYKMAGKLIMGIISPFMLEIGCSKYILGAFKIFAGLLTAIIVFFTNFISTYFGKKKSIIFMQLLYIIVPILFIVSILIHNIYFALYVCLLDKILRASQSNLAFIAQSQCIDGEYAMTQISIISCIERVIGRFLTTISGYIIEYFKESAIILYLFQNLSSKMIGWVALFSISTISIIFSIYFTYLFLKTNVIKEIC